MVIILYNTVGSPPCHAVRLAALHLGIELQLKEMDIDNGDQMKPEFLKMNPEHTVPTLDDNGFFLTESHAILPYFVNKYGTKDDDPLYPKDPQARYLVDQRLAFNLGSLYQRFISVIFARIYDEEPVKPRDVKKINEGLGFANAYLEKTPFIAGDHLTIADFSVTITLACMEAVNFDLSPHPAVVKYLAKMKAELKGYNEQVKTGADEFAEWVFGNVKIDWKL